MKYQIHFGSASIDFTLKYQERKSISIQVLPDTTVEVLASKDIDEKKILEKVKLKALWIIKQIDFFRSFHPLTQQRKFVNGETHLYLGRQHKLKIVKSDLNVIKVYRGQMWLYSDSTEPDILKSHLEKWYKEKAVVIFHELLEELLPRFQRYNITKPLLIIRRMSNRWGSCTAAGRIILNIELIKASKGSIEYVLIHELCHLVHNSHNKKFFKLLNKILPDWEKRKDKLERILA